MRVTHHGLFSAQPMVWCAPLPKMARLSALSHLAHFRIWAGLYQDNSSTHAPEPHAQVEYNHEYWHHLSPSVIQEACQWAPHHHRPVEDSPHHQTSSGNEATPTSRRWLWMGCSERWSLHARSWRWCSALGWGFIQRNTRTLHPLWRLSRISTDAPGLE